MALTIPNTFQTGDTALASEVNANFQAVKTEVDLKIGNTLLTTKGDIIAASAASTPARLSVGTNGQTLLADSTATNGVAWGQVANAGVATGAAIDKTKIAGTAVTLSDTGTVTSAMITNDTIVDADINSAAAIALSKLATTGTVTATTFVGALTGTASGNLVSGGALGTPSSGTLTNCTFPTLNQNTTGTAAAATLAAKASTLSQGGANGTAMTFNWSGQAGQPAYYWGSNDGTNHYVYQPGNLSVGTSTYATSAVQGAGEVSLNPSSQTGSFSEPPGTSYTMSFTLNFGRFWGTALVPRNNNATNLGSGTLRWSTIYSQNVLNVSDARLKTEITPTDLGLEFVNKLNPVSYKWIEGGYLPVDETDSEQVANKIGLPRAGVRKHYGLIAQELKATLDELNVEDFAGYVQDDLTDPDSTLSISYNNLFAPMIKSIQELSNKIDSLTDRINALEE